MKLYLFPSSRSLLTSQNRTTNAPIPVIYNNCHQPDLFTSCNLLVAALILGMNKINSAKLEARKSGKDVVDLGYGNPDIPSHPLVVEKLIESARLTKNHKYSVSRGIQGLRNAITEKYSRSYDVSLDPEKNIVNTYIP